MAKIEAKPGDFVEVDFVKNTYQGVFLEAPKDEKGIILLKLNSGYNIGLNKKDILDMRILKKVEEKESNIEIKKRQVKTKHCNDCYRRDNFL